MEIVTRKSKAKTAVAYWCEPQHGDESAYRQELIRRLRALGGDPDPDEVNRILGGDHWTTLPPCGECGRASPTVVQVGEKLDHETATAWLCPSCVLRAAALVDASPFHAAADWLEENGHAAAAVALRKAFPLADVEAKP